MVYIESDRFDFGSGFSWVVVCNDGLETGMTKLIPKGEVLLNLVHYNYDLLNCVCVWECDKERK